MSTITTPAKPKPYTVAHRDVVAILHLVAGHDTNGNPRRGYLLLGREGYPIGYVDEGYRGPDAMADVIRGYPKACGMSVNPRGRPVYGPRTLPWPVSITTTPKELREWRGKAWGV